MKLAWKRVDQSVENKLLWIDHLGGLDCAVKTRERVRWKQSTITFAILPLILECQNCKCLLLEFKRTSGDNLFLQCFYKKLFYCKSVGALFLDKEMRSVKYTDNYKIGISGEITKLHSSSPEEEGSMHALVVNTAAATVHSFISLLFPMNCSYLSLCSLPFVSPVLLSSRPRGQKRRRGSEQRGLENLGRGIELQFTSPKLQQGLNSTTKEISTQKIIHSPAPLSCLFY